MAHSHTAHIAGDLDTAFVRAMAAWELHPQNPEVALNLALVVAIWARDLDRVRLTAERIAQVKASGEMFRAQRLAAEAAVAALEGRSADAIAAFRESRDVLLALEQQFDAATVVVNAAQLLPLEPEVRAWADEARALLETMRATPWLDRLDSALEHAEPLATKASSASEVPSPG